MPESFVSMGRGHSCLLRLLPLSRMGTEGSLAVPPSAGTVSVLRWHSGCGHRPVARAGLVPFHPRQHLRLRHGPARVAGWEPARREMPARCDPSSAAPSRRLQSPVTFQMQQLPYRAGRLPAREEAGTARGKETTHTWTRRMGGNDPLSQHKGMLPGGTNMPPPAPRCWQDSVPLEPAPGTAGLGLPPGLWSAEAAEVGGVWHLTQPCLCGTWALPRPGWSHSPAPRSRELQARDDAPTDVQQQHKHIKACPDGSE